MTPLGKVIQSRMTRLGWSAREVERRGGPSASTINRLVSNDPRANRNPPSDENLELLASVLVVPLAKLVRAAEETRGKHIPTPAQPEHVETLAAALAGLDEASQEVLTEVVVMVADRIRAAGGREDRGHASIDPTEQEAAEALRQQAIAEGINPQPRQTSSEAVATKKPPRRR